MSDASGCERKFSTALPANEVATRRGQPEDDIFQTQQPMDSRPHAGWSAGVVAG